MGVSDVSSATMSTGARAAQAAAAAAAAATLSYSSQYADYPEYAGDDPSASQHNDGQNASEFDSSQYADYQPQDYDAAAAAMDVGSEGDNGGGDVPYATDVVGGGGGGGDRSGGGSSNSAGAPVASERGQKISPDLIAKTATLPKKPDEVRHRLC